jgi:hypothetical protein
LTQIDKKCTRPYPAAKEFWPIGFGTAEAPQQDFTRGICLWGSLLCVGTRTKPPTGQHSCPPTHILVPLVSSLPLQHHTTNTRNRQSPLPTSNPQRFFLHNLLETNIKVDDHKKRALAQDDNSEPRRSPIQVLTAQRFSPNSCSALRVSLRLTTTTSCVARFMCFFPTVVCFLLCRHYSPQKDAQRMPQDNLPEDLPPR